jgi:hypothetical protein
MRKIVVAGYAVSLVGMALWLYGYFATGHLPLIDWRSTAPWWIADYLPNLESEIGMALAFGSMVLVYWPDRRK